MVLPFRRQLVLTTPAVKPAVFHSGPIEPLVRLTTPPRYDLSDVHRLPQLKACRDLDNAIDDHAKSDDDADDR